MWQKPAQPSASYIPASNRGSGFCSLYRYPLFAFLLSSCILSSTSRSLRPASFFPSRPVARSSLLPLLLSLITVGVARQQPAHRGQANFLPAVILFRSSPPPPVCLSLSLGLSRPLRRESLPFAPRSLYPLPLSISRRFFPFFFFSLDTQRLLGLSVTPSSTMVFPQCCIVIISTILVPTPFCSISDDATRLINFRDANR